MKLLKADRTKVRLSACAVAVTLISVSSVPAVAASFTTKVFASGSAVSATAPDSVSYGNGSLWIEYGNGVSSTDYSGNSTIVQYTTSGMVQNTWSIGGEVDGLKVNPNTGMVWALQNQDANSRLSIINPSTKAVSAFTYGAPYTASSGTRGFDDVAFVGNNVYLSEANPASTSDPIVVKLNNSTPASPITQTAILTGVGIPATDPDSLKSTPAGELLLSGSNDRALNLVSNPGRANQSVKSILITGPNGTQIGTPDDAIFSTSAAGTFYLTDDTANMIYAVSATGLLPNSLFVNTGGSFGIVDQTTGVVTPLVSGTSLHGIEFVPSTTATPEPGTLGISLLAAGFFAVLLYRRRLAK